MQPRAEPKESLDDLHTDRALSNNLASLSSKQIRENKSQHTCRRGSLSKLASYYTASVNFTTHTIHNELELPGKYYQNTHPTYYTLHFFATISLLYEIVLHRFEQKMQNATSRTQSVDLDVTVSINCENSLVGSHRVAETHGLR